LDNFSGLVVWMQQAHLSLRRRLPWSYPWRPPHARADPWKRWISFLPGGTCIGCNALGLRRNVLDAQLNNWRSLRHRLPEFRWFQIRVLSIVLHPTYHQSAKSVISSRASVLNFIWFFTPNKGIIQPVRSIFPSRPDLKRTLISVSGSDLTAQPDLFSDFSSPILDLPNPLDVDPIKD